MKIRNLRIDEAERYQGQLNMLLESDRLRDWAGLFRTFGKLSGDLQEDAEFITEFVTLLEKDVEKGSEEVEFDPFGHLTAKGKIDVKDDCVLTFGRGNDKLKYLDSEAGVIHFSLPAGYTCPFADICKSIAHKKGGKFPTGSSIKDFGKIRCYAASAELYSPQARKARWRNFDLLKKHKSADEIADLISRSLDYFAQTTTPFRLVRVHEAGDFYSQEYFDGWMETARRHPDKLFYAYTKSLPMWVKRKEDIPKNFRLIASQGGKHDELIDQHKLRFAQIVQNKEEAAALKMPIDPNDYYAALEDGNFALLLHGVQPAAAKAGPTLKANKADIKKYAPDIPKRAEILKRMRQYIQGVEDEK